jgi:hypothetical protein
MALATINWNPTHRHLRQFGGAGALICLALASWGWFQHGTTIAPAIFSGLGTGLILSAAFTPSILKPVFIGMMLVTYPIGWVISHVVMAVIYFGIFSIVALIFKLMGRDALQRRLLPQAVSYWQPKTMPSDPRSYLRQF